MIETAVYLGPATIVAAAERDVRVRLRDGEEADARLAVAGLYAPAEGDEVLVIRQDTDETYVIGVLRGQGRTAIEVPGDLELRAPRGRIELCAARGVSIRSDESLDLEGRTLTLRGGRVEVLARRIVEKAEDVYRWISGLFQTKSGRLRTVVDGACYLKAERAYLRTDADMNIDGKTINLG